MSSTMAEKKDGIVARRKLALDAVMRSDDALFILADIIEDCGVHQTTHVSNNPHDSAFREGRRFAGLQVLGLFDEYPEQYYRMLKLKAEI